MKALYVLVDNVAKEKDLSGMAFKDALLEIQKAIGEGAGGYEKAWFSGDNIRRWELGDNIDRTELIVDYIQGELLNLADPLNIKG
jgi:hypothetical protein